MKWNNQISHCNDAQLFETDRYSDDWYDYENDRFYENVYEKQLADKLDKANESIFYFQLSLLMIFIAHVIGLAIVLFGEIYHA